MELTTQEFRKNFYTDFLTGGKSYEISLDKSKETIDKVWEEVRSQVDSKVDAILDETSQ